MRIFILTLGTRGDLELLALLAGEMRRRGHDAVLGSSRFHAERAQAFDVEWHAVTSSGIEELRAILESLAGVADPLERTRAYFRRWLRPEIERARPAIAALAAGADYFVSNLKLTVERGGRRLPCAFVDYDPPVGAMPAPPPRPGGRDGAPAPLELVAMSRSLVDPARAWDPRHRFTGFWNPGEDTVSPPAPDLARFVAAGPPPVVLTMGSMVTFDPVRLAATFAAALAAGGQRGVVVGGWARLRRPSDGTVFSVGEAPYAWLFPRSACVVHHGGTGTTAAVLRAGRPSVVLPQIACQAAYGEMLRGADLAGAVLGTDGLSPATLAAALRRISLEPRFAQAARDWRNTVIADPGVIGAADLIEAHALRGARRGAGNGQGDR